MKKLDKAVVLELEYLLLTEDGEENTFLSSVIFLRMTTMCIRHTRTGKERVAAWGI